MLRLLAAALFLCVASPAVSQAQCVVRDNNPCSAASGPWQGAPLMPSERTGRVSAVVVGGRPAGCPRAYCGCASARYVGLKGAQWNLAANWLRLPRAAPAAGMAAARRGHVFILKRHVSGNRWVVYDPNSGRGLTRVHVRSLAGYTVVNPRGWIYASARRR